MGSSRDDISALRACWRTPADGSEQCDYVLLVELAGLFGARSRAGLPALVIPLPSGASSAVGRSAAGCELISHSSARFSMVGRTWAGPAAVLLCTEPALVNSFSVLATDVAHHVAEDGATWRSVVSAVEEWQRLLAPRGKPSAEAEVGLWGELWFLAQSADVGRLLEGWRGPESASSDFFVGGIAAEVKTTRRNREHHVSQSQVDIATTGTFEPWLVSLWVQVDPAARSTVHDLVEDILERSPDPADALKRVARAGFSPGDGGCYSTSFTLLAEPEWYSIADVPRVRLADPGVSHLRYRIVLDVARRAKPAVVDRLQRHFHGTKTRS